MYKTIMITGTSRGLGLTIASYFVKQGCYVIGLSRSVYTPLFGESNYIHRQVDLRDRQSVADTFSSLNNIKIDLLINNAAIFAMSPFDITTLDTVDDIIDTNLKGSIYVTKNAIPLMEENSRIIFINSVAGIEELENQSIYCASKYALTAFAGVLGKELRSRKIKVTSIHPGGINTPLWNSSNPYPCGNVENAIDPIEIAKLIEFIYLGSPNLEYKTVKLFPDIEWH
jgi:NAD(P)-dependent dehydrogenase (short-subunit alcohol dehydrogenase family)